MLAEHPTVRINDLPGLLTELTLEKTARVTVGNKANVVTVGLVADAEPAPIRLSTHLGLIGEVSEREHRARKPFGPHHRKHVALVLEHVRAPVERARPFRTLVPNRGIVARADRIESKQTSAVHERRKLDPLVTAHAWIRGAAARVLRKEILHHEVVEVVREVPHVIRNPNMIRRAAGIRSVFDRAAPARTVAGLFAVFRQRHMHTHDIVALLNGERRSHSRIDTATHRGKNLHLAPFTRMRCKRLHCTKRKPRTHDVRGASHERISGSTRPLAPAREPPGGRVRAPRHPLSCSSTRVRTG